MSKKDIEIIKHSKDGSVNISQYGVEIRHAGEPVSMTSVAGYVYLVVDCSYSMNGNKLDQAKEGSLRFIKNALIKGYLIGLIQFDSSAIRLCEPQKEISILEQCLRKIKIGNSTNMSEAIHLANESLKNRVGSRVMVIVTDGEPDNPEISLMAAENAKKDGIDIITIGTDGADLKFLKKIASRTELGIKVLREQLGESIASSVKMLPQLEHGEKEK